MAKEQLERMLHRLSYRLGIHVSRQLFSVLSFKLAVHLNRIYLTTDLGKLRAAGRIRPFTPLCPARVMPMINNINETKICLFFSFILKFDNLLFFFNVCGDPYIIISHSIVKHYQNQLLKLFTLKKFTVEVRA